MRGRSHRAPLLAVVLGASLALAGCSGPAAVSQPGAQPSSAPVPSVTSSPPKASLLPASTASAAPAPSAGPKAPKVFPPPAFEAPHARTKKEGDGVFVPLDVHRGVGQSSPIARTVVHPHPIRPFVIVELLAIDTSRVDLTLVAGTAEPDGTSVPVERRTGLVPEARRKDLIAVTNGGFKKRHGGHGIVIGSDVMLEPKTTDCVFAQTSQGGFRVGSWSALSAERKDLSWARGTPPCLIEGGTKHPDLQSAHGSKKWGGAEDGNKEIRRSAFGIGDDPHIVYFAIGDWVTAEWLTDALEAAGVKGAAEFDINYSYTRFIVYEHSESGISPTSPLLKDLKAPRKEYLSDPSERDFFFLAWK